MPAHARSEYILQDCVLLSYKQGYKKGGTNGLLRTQHRVSCAFCRVRCRHACNRWSHGWNHWCMNSLVVFSNDPLFSSAGCGEIEHASCTPRYPKVDGKKLHSWERFATRKTREFAEMMPRFCLAHSSLDFILCEKPQLKQSLFQEKGFKFFKLKYIIFYFQNELSQGTLIRPACIVENILNFNIVLYF